MAAKRKSRAKRECLTTLLDELRIAHTQGQCTAPIQGIPGRLWCVEAKTSWGDLACMLSLNLPGQFWVGSNGITHVNGSIVTYLAPYERLAGIKEAMVLCHECTGLAPEKIPCSNAGVARKMLEWCNVQQRERRALDGLGAQQHWQFQRCEPQDIDQAYLWDITSCYFSLLQRAPSARVILLRGKLHWCPMSKEERFRWERMLRYAAPHKGVRNSFIGQMYAAGNGEFYSDGRSNLNHEHIDKVRARQDIKDAGWEAFHLDDIHAKVEKPATPGPLRPLASLIVRSAYELCALAYEETRAVYANTDCVITRQDASPAIWRKYGLTVALKGSGPTEVNCIGFYKVGSKRTEHFKNAEKRGTKRPRIPAGNEESEHIKLILAGKTWCDQWLTPSESWEPSLDELARFAPSPVAVP